MNQFLPLLITLMECFCLYARTTRPTGTAASLFVELCQDVLQLEPLGHSMIYFLDTKHKSLLQSLQQMTISFAKTLFANHEHTRNNLITLSITLLHSTYSNKNPYKPFLLHHQVHSDNNPHVTLGIIMLMTCMQSACNWTVHDKVKLDLCSSETIDIRSINNVRTSQSEILEEMMVDVQKVTSQFANELLQVSLSSISNTEIIIVFLWHRRDAITKKRPLNNTIQYLNCCKNFCWLYNYQHGQSRQCS